MTLLIRLAIVTGLAAVALGESIRGIGWKLMQVGRKP